MEARSVLAAGLWCCAGDGGCDYSSRLVFVCDRLSACEGWACGLPLVICQTRPVRVDFPCDLSVVVVTMCCGGGVVLARVLWSTWRRLRVHAWCGNSTKLDLSEAVARDGQRAATAQAIESGGGRVKSIKPQDSRSYSTTSSTM